MADEERFPTRKSAVISPLIVDKKGNNVTSGDWVKSIQEVAGNGISLSSFAEQENLKAPAIPNTAFIRVTQDGITQTATVTADGTVTGTGSVKKMTPVDTRNLLQHVHNITLGDTANAEQLQIGLDAFRKAGVIERR